MSKHRQLLLQNIPIADMGFHSKGQLCQTQYNTAMYEYMYQMKFGKLNSRHCKSKDTVRFSYKILSSLPSINSNNKKMSEDSPCNIYLIFHPQRESLIWHPNAIDAFASEKQTFCDYPSIAKEIVDAYKYISPKQKCTWTKPEQGLFLINKDLFYANTNMSLKIINKSFKIILRLCWI